MALIERTADTGVAHGLRQHSIGGTFPAIVVGRGDGSTEVHLGKHILKCNSTEQAFRNAEYLGSVHRSVGWDDAVEVLQQLNKVH